MRKKMLAAAFLLFFLHPLWNALTGTLSRADANGVIVTEPEEKKPAPKKKAPAVKKAAPAQASPKGPVKQEPAPRGNTALEEGLRLLEQRFFTRALALLEQAVVEEPGSADAWYALGQTCREKGLFMKAQAAYRNVLEIAPDYAALSRVLDDSSRDGRIPLWDPKRPSRIEDIPVIAGEPGQLQALEISQPQTAAPEIDQPGNDALSARHTPPANQAASSKNSAKLRPFVPVRIIKPEDGKMAAKPKEEGTDGPAPIPASENLNSPVYIPPPPPGAVKNDADKKEQ